MALVNQRASAAGKPPVGLLGPAISAIGQSTSYNNDFHDITSGNNDCCAQSIFYSAVTGYDLVTGWGSPTAGLIDALAGIPETTPDFALSASINTLGSPGVTIGQSSSGTNTLTVTSLNGFSAATELAVLNLPAGVTATFSSNPVTPPIGGQAASTLTLTASSTAATGTFNLAVTGSAGSITRRYNIALTVYSSTPLSGYDVYGIYTDGTVFQTGGLDGGGAAYSSVLLGSSLVWTGTTFRFGPANALDVYSNEPTSLPAGSYQALKILATGVQGSQVAQPFIITYTDGTTTTVMQSLSDWFAPQNFSGESIAASYAYRVLDDGTTDPGPFNLYGYRFTFNSEKKTVKSLTLPNNRNVVVLAIVPTS